MKGISLDPDVVTEHYAVVRVGRRLRERIPETTVHIVDSQEEAIKQSDPDKHQYAARVAGPSRSSEGLRVYYIIEWFNKPA